MKAFGVVAFVAGLLLAIRVMFFGVQRKLGEDRVAFRRWPLALASFLLVLGAMLYGRAAKAGSISLPWTALTLLIAFMGGAAAWLLVQRSAALPSTDPEDDPEFRFQGQVARVVESIEERGGAPPTGRIAFDFDGKRYEFRARWTAGDWRPDQGRADSEVVIERVDDDLAFVEPWAAIEERL